MRFVRKIGKFAIISVKLGLKPNNWVKSTENSHNSRLYTIQHKSVRNSHLLSQISGISSNAKTIVISTSINCSHTKISKEQLTAHMPIVKRIAVSVTNTHLSSSNALLCQLVSQTHKLLKQLNTTDIANYNINRYNGSFFSY